MLASGIRRWHDEKQATNSAHLFEEETLAGREALQTLDDIVDCDFLSFFFREAGSKYLQLCGELWHIDVVFVSGSDFLDFVRKVISANSLQQQGLKFFVDGVPGLVKTSGDTAYCQV